ncbi:MAG: hypothetical protein J6C75_00810, partial [Oscillospiraceae bacterium]|nr:hypothetical protein [Oscillospiraceae bacterium]
IPAGVYITHQINAVNDAFTKLNNPYLTPAELLKSEIDGVPAEQWINNRAAELVKSYAAIEAEAARLGVSLDAGLASLLEQEVDATWAADGEMMASLGVSAESAKLVAKNNQLANVVFEKIYGEGGEKGVSAEELEQYFVDNYARSMIVILPLKDMNTGLPLDEEKAAEVKKLYEGYKAKIAAGSTVFDIYVEENARQRALAEITEPAELVESEREVLVPKNDTSYPEKLRETLFATTEYKKPLFYEDENFLVIFDRREAMADKAGYDEISDSLLMVYKAEEFRNGLGAIADAAGYKLNNDIVKAFTAAKILEINY